MSNSVFAQYCDYFYTLKTDLCFEKLGIQTMILSTISYLKSLDFSPLDQTCYLVMKQKETPRVILLFLIFVKYEMASIVLSFHSEKWTFSENDMPI